LVSLTTFFFYAFLSPEKKIEKSFSLYDERNSSYYEATSFYRGKVIEAEYEEVNYQDTDQKLKVVIMDNDLIGKEFLVDHRTVSDIDESHIFKEGDNVVLTTTDKRTFYVGDHLRQNGLILALFIFMITILYFGRVRGIGAIFGLGFSFLVLIYYIIPKIISGEEIIKVALIGILIISGVSIFLAHGVSKKANVIWISTVVTLLVAVFLSHFFVEITNLFGRGSDVDFSFSFGEYSHVSLKGLLFAGLIIGVFGVITDVVSTQTAAIWQIKRANPDLGRKELYQRGILVGREHIASLVNTLILVYVGASLPLFIIIMGIEHTPLWVMINGEIIAEEIIRAITGSVSLILGVPVSSFLASYFANKQGEEKTIPIVSFSNLDF
jgi:uncharacterized membrane protein